MLHHHHRSLTTIAEQPTRSSSRTAYSTNTELLAVKLRNQFATPPQTHIFHLPKSRVLQTSAYFRAHVDALPGSPSSPSKHKDGIVRLNYPDFAIFGIYEEWLRTGTIHTKASLRALHPKSTFASPSYPHESHYECDEDPQRADPDMVSTFQDYLGAYFLGTWLQDTAFKDSLASYIISKINAGHAHAFLSALKPSLVNLVLTDEKATLGMRRLIFAAIARFGREDGGLMERLVPDEGMTCERGVVRGLLGYLLNNESREGMYDRTGSREKYVSDEELRRRLGESVSERLEPPWALARHSRCDEGDGRSMHRKGQTEPPPPPFMPRVQDMWDAMSHVSWPSTTDSMHKSCGSKSTFVSEGKSAGNSMTSYIHTSAGSKSTSISNKKWAADSVIRATCSEFETSTASALITHTESFRPLNIDGQRREIDNDGNRTQYAEWRRTKDKYCDFHEHTYLGLPCFLEEVTGRP